MASENPNSASGDGRERLLDTLEQLLAIESTSVSEASSQAAQLVARALAADKVDAFLHDPAIDSLVVAGLSDTPMSHRQVALGLDRLPVANGGRLVQVYQTGRPFTTAHADEDTEVTRGMVEGLGVRSIVAAPLEIAGRRRGVLQAATARPEAFTGDDLRFLEATARWVGMVLHRAELMEQTARQAEEQGRRMIAEDLVTTLAHDLNNLLTPLRWHLQLLARRATREGRQRDLQDAHGALESVVRLTGLVANLLDVARLDRGIFNLEAVPVDLVALVNETVRLFKTSTDQIRVQAPEELTLIADPDRVRQVMENLLSNAIKHTPAGRTVTVRVETEERPIGDDAEEMWAVVRVSDRGPGIAEEILPRLFERFSSGAGSTGLGLGLYLARQIAEAHGGMLTVTSEPGRGATFQLALPWEPQPAVEPGDESEGEEPLDVAAAPGERGGVAPGVDGPREE